MTFDLKNVPAIFQAVIEQVLRPVAMCASYCINDVIIYSASWKDHLRDLEGVFTCLLDAGLKVKLSKSVFGRKYMSYLGHQVGNGKFAVPLYRVKSMKRYGKPQTKKQLR